MFSGPSPRALIACTQQLPHLRAGLPLHGADQHAFAFMHLLWYRSLSPSKVCHLYSQQRLLKPSCLLAIVFPAARRHRRTVQPRRSTVRRHRSTAQRALRTAPRRRPTARRPLLTVQPRLPTALAAQGRRQQQQQGEQEGSSRQEQQPARGTVPQSPTSVQRMGLLQLAAVAGSSRG